MNIKKAIFQLFPELKENPTTNERIGYKYPGSMQRGKAVATQLAPSGNGYVSGLYMDSEIIEEKGYKVDERGWISIKNFSSEELRDVTAIAMNSMSGKKAKSVYSINLKKEEKENEPALVEKKKENADLKDWVHSCLYNWLGYGNIYASIWLMGMEEGGA